MALELDTLDVLVKTGVNIRELVIEANVSLCVGVSVLYECRAGDPSKVTPHPTMSPLTVFLSFRAIPGPLYYEFLETYNMYFRIASNR